MIKKFVKMGRVSQQRSQKKTIKIKTKKVEVVDQDKLDMLKYFGVKEITKQEFETI